MFVLVEGNYRDANSFYSPHGLNEVDEAGMMRSFFVLAVFHERRSRHWVIIPVIHG